MYDFDAAALRTDLCGRDVLEEKCDQSLLLWLLCGAGVAESAIMCSKVLYHALPASS